MASERWEYDERSHRYRNKETGRFLSPSTMVELRDDFIERRRAELVRLVERLADKDFGLAEWELRMRAQVKSTFGVQYALGRGGRNAMGASDWQAVGKLVRGQWEFLHGFAQDLHAGKLSPAQAAARAQLYLNASVQAHEHGRAAAHGGLALPAYPADGGTSCRANCRCTWSITETETLYFARWVLSASEHCDGCRSRGRRWNPLILPKAVRSVSSLRIVEGVNVA